MVSRKFLLPLENLKQLVWEDSILGLQRTHFSKNIYRWTRTIRDL